MLKKIIDVFESISRARTAAALASMGNYKAAQAVMVNENLKDWV